jgi:hypothetical protein
MKPPSPSGPRLGSGRWAPHVRARAWALQGRGSRPAKCPAQADDEAPSLPLGDWREFRAKLISQSGAAMAMGPKRVAQENVRLLEEQNPSLAAEEMWAHATPGPEKGGVLIATPAASKILGNDKYWQVRPRAEAAARAAAAWRLRPCLQPTPAALALPLPPPPIQAVIFLVEHNEGGSVGLILNRPTGMVMGRKPGGLPFVIAVRSRPAGAGAASCTGARGGGAVMAAPGAGRAAHAPPFCGQRAASAGWLLVALTPGSLCAAPAAGRAAHDAEHL